MRLPAFVLLSCLAVNLALAVGREQDPARTATNKTELILPPVPTVTSNGAFAINPHLATNTVAVVFASRTNVLLFIRQPDGTYTNIEVRGPELDLRRYRFDAIWIAPNSHGPGDYWLPGEYERALEEKKNERKPTPP